MHKQGKLVYVTTDIWTVITDTMNNEIWKNIKIDHL